MQPHVLQVIVRRVTVAAHDAGSVRAGDQVGALTGARPCGNIIINCRFLLRNTVIHVILLYIRQNNANARISN